MTDLDLAVTSPSEFNDCRKPVKRDSCQQPDATGEFAFAHPRSDSSQSFAMATPDTDGQERAIDRARSLAARLSLEEQVSLLSGADFWRTVAIPDKGIPSIKTTDGPNGARGQYFKNGTPAALFPCGVSLAATWDTRLIHEIGKHLGEETKARGADVLLAPTVCMHRSPLGGRNFESFSEDPFLTGKLAAAYVQGLQSKRVAATIKHFVANEQETERMSIDSVVDERTLREIYLKPFEIAIREASPWAVMTSYNRVNGVHADMNDHALKRVLRDEWGFDGTVISDWGGTNSVAESVKAGCDLEMPGPTHRRGQQLIDAYHKGEITSQEIERAATNVLHLVDRTRGLNGPPEQQERSIDNPYTRELILQAGVEGLTLLKNERNILPLRQPRKIAVIGPNAKRAIAGGGGSASLNPYYTTTPFEGLSAHTDAELLYAKGCDTSKWVPLAEAFCTTSDGQQGVILEYYHGDKFQGKPIETQHKQTTGLYLWDSAPSAVLPAYSFKVRTCLTPKSTGMHTFSFSSVGPGRLFLDGQIFVDNWDWTEEGEAMFDDSVSVEKKIYLEAGRSVDVLVESTNELRPLSKQVPGGKRYGYGGCRIGYQEQLTENLLHEAANVASMADAAIVFVGLDGEWESEGYDRQTMDLPRDGSQDELIEAVLAANPNTIVVNQSGTPIVMPWADRVPAIIQAWYQGQEAGNALAQVLLGLANPSGKLPVTFPKRLQDNPSVHNWPGENGKVVYEEGIFIGYRHYDTRQITPQFAFGHGLSYTTFEYGEATIDSDVLGESSTLTISLTITNTGGMSGREVVQAYVRDLDASVARPDKELQAFATVTLNPAESKVIHLPIDKHSVGYYNTGIEAWTARSGRFDVLIGASSLDIRCTVSFEVAEPFTWIF